MELTSDNICTLVTGAEIGSEGRSGGWDGVRGLGVGDGGEVGSCGVGVKVGGVWVV